MKKLIALVLVMVVVAALFPSAAPSKAPVLAQSDEEYVMVSNVAAHPYWLDAQYGGQDAAKELGVEVDLRRPGGLQYAGAGHDAGAGYRP